MNTATINIKTTQTMKAQAETFAKERGISLSKLFEDYLKKLIRTKRARKEKPNDYLIQSLKESEEDVKAGRVISFESGQEALDYVRSLIRNDKNKKPSHSKR